MEKLLQIWPNVGALSQDLGLPYQTVQSWRRRGLPARRLPEIQRAAARRGHAITLESLMAMTAPNTMPDPLASAAVEDGMAGARADGACPGAPAPLPPEAALPGEAA